MSRARVTLITAVLVGLALGWSATVANHAVADHAGAEPVVLSGAVLEWAVNEESNTGAFNGQCNFMSGGISDGSAATYRAVDGDATVLKRTAAGTDEPIADYSSRCRDATGATVTAGGSARLGQKVRYVGGTGTLDPATGAATIVWRGTFSLNYYGTLVPFWFSDPVLRVDAAGNGSLTATVGGYSSSIDDPEVRELIDPIPGVELATLTGVEGANLDGFVVTPDYEDVLVEGAESPQIRAFPGWGSWPVSHVRAMERLGLGAFWYTTGGATDSRKPPAPLVVSYGTGTAPTTTTAVPTTAVPTTAVPTTVAPTTTAPTSGPTAPTPEQVLAAAGTGSGAVGTASTPSGSNSSLGRVVAPTGGGPYGSAAPPAAADGPAGAADERPGDDDGGPATGARAGGELRFTELEATYLASANPLAPGAMRLTYRVRNTGDVSLRATRTAIVSPGLGGAVVAEASDLTELAPGRSETFTQTVPGVWPGGSTNSRVELVPYVPGDDDVRVRTVIARTTTTLTPWPQAVLAVALVAAAAAGLLARRRRRRGARLPAAPGEAQGTADPTPTPWRTT